jgi:RNA polymerase sigma factor (sigma-70 family)
MSEIAVAHPPPLIDLDWVDHADLAEHASDPELLRRFVRTRDEAAFAHLVTRYQPLVWGICWRLLGNRHDADDACQAVFLVLARKGNAFTGAGSLAGWLYRVARRVSLRSRKSRARRETQNITTEPAMHTEPWTRSPRSTRSRSFKKSWIGCPNRSGCPSCCAASKAGRVRKPPECWAWRQAPSKAAWSAAAANSGGGSWSGA